MKLNRRTRSTLIGLNMTPMIDCVFLLLIFFMTVSQISEPDHEAIDLPKLQGSEDQEPSVITINVLEDGEILIGGESSSITDVVRFVSDELEYEGDDPSRLSVIVRADHRGESRTVNEIMRGLNQLGIAKVRVAVEVPQ